MAGEYDDKFEEITGILQKMQRSVGGIDELRMEVRDIRNEFRAEAQNIRDDLHENVKETKLVGQKLDILSAQFQDVSGLVLKDHHPRIERAEERLDVLESNVH